MTESKAREFEFQEPVELQEWYDIGADIRINIRKQFHKAANEIDQLQSELKAKDELLRECEKALEMIATNIKRESKYLHWTSVDIAKEMLQKLREGKK